MEDRSLSTAALRRRPGVLTVRCQRISLLGSLGVYGPGAAAGRGQAAELKACSRREERAYALSRVQGRNSYRTGFAKHYVWL